nr:molybdate ABC transporter substrate-binding protein [Bacillus sp. FJAT-27916]
MKRGKNCLYVLALLFLLTLAGCQSSEGESKEKVELIISAAASLQNVLGEIKTVYEEENEDISLVFNYGGSGALQHQIENGAPADLFISAAIEPFELLLQNGWIDKEAQTNLLSNELVLVAGDQSEMRGIENLESASKIAIGSPDSVPAGQYAKQSLEALGLWETVKDKLVPTKDVTQVLTYVETGNVEVGFVYATDAKNSSQVKVIDTVPDESHEAIIYPAGVISSSKEKENAEELYRYLQSDEAQKIFEKYGFKGLK